MTDNDLAHEFHTLISGVIPDRHYRATRSRSTVLTDSFNNSAASSWVSSGCISDRLVNGDHETTGGDCKTR
jgi:hypothetical protein